MTFSKEESSEMEHSEIVELENTQRQIVQLKMKQNGLADDENELRVEDVSSSSSLVTTSDESEFANALGLGQDGQDKANKLLPKLPMLEQSP